MNKITFVVVCFNSAKYIIHCIDSILNQSYQNYDIIIVDNNSSDDSVSLVQQTFQKNPKISIIINDKNLGYGNSITIAAKQTESEFLAILNADSYLDKDWSKHILNKFHSNSQLVSVSGKVLFPDGTLQSMGGMMDKYGAVIQRDSKEYVLRNLGKSDFFFYNDGSSFMIRKKILNEISFDSKLFLYYEDVDFSWKLRMLSYEIDLSPDAVSYHYLGHSEMQMTPSKFYHIAKNRMYICKKNYSMTNNFTRIPVMIFLIFMNAIYYDFNNHSKCYFIKFLKAVFWNMSNYKHVIKEHKILQKLRKISDKQLDTHILQKSIEISYLFKN